MPAPAVTEEIPTVYTSPAEDLTGRTTILSTTSLNSDLLGPSFVTTLPCFPRCKSPMPFLRSRSPSPRPTLRSPSPRPVIGRGGGNVSGLDALLNDPESAFFGKDSFSMVSRVRYLWVWTKNCERFITIPCLGNGCNVLANGCARVLEDWFSMEGWKLSRTHPPETIVESWMKHLRKERRNLMGFDKLYFALDTVPIGAADLSRFVDTSMYDNFREYHYVTQVVVRVHRAPTRNTEPAVAVCLGKNLFVYEKLKTGPFE